MKTVQLTRLGSLLPCLGGAALLLQGCSPPAAGWNGLFAVDQAGGARTCVASTASVPDGKAIVEQVQVSDEGGWCGFILNHGGSPYDSYLLTTRPAHGRVFAHRVGGNTRIDYTPDTGYTGADQFTVRLIPGDAVVEETVRVTR